MAKWITVFCFLGYAATGSLAGYNYPAPLPIPISGHNPIIGGPISTGNVFPEGLHNQEGQIIDPNLISKVKDIILTDEIERQAIRGSISPVYGVPNRIVGIKLDPIRQAIEINQLHQSTLVRGPDYIGSDISYPVGSSNGYSSIPSGSYGVPAPAIDVSNLQPINHY